MAREELGGLYLIGVLVTEGTGGEECVGIPDVVLGEMDWLADLVAASRCDLRGFRGERGSSLLIPSTGCGIAAAAEGFRGERGSSLLIPQGSVEPLIVLIGTGQQPSGGDLGGNAGETAVGVLQESLRVAGAVLSRQIGMLDTGHAAGGACLLLGPPANTEADLQAITEGLLLGSYSFDTYKTEREQAVEQRTVVIASLVADPPAGGTDHERFSDNGHAGRNERGAGRGHARGEVVASCAMLARDLINTPASDMTPSIFCERAGNLAGEAGLDVEIWDAMRIAQEGLGGLAGVSRGSGEPPRLLKITYDPVGDPSVPDSLSGDGDVPSIVLVGKGITFDSGGLSLKSAEPMATMKTDMSGAAAVCATALACARLGVGIRVTAIAPLAENMPGESGIKPGDVLEMRNGHTVEVLNTDAEGRLILADAISLAAEMNPHAIVDVATLTGACVVALGKEIAGMFCNDERLASKVMDASLHTGERVWRLPLAKEYRGHIESEIADMKNIGKPGQAGSIVAALMLERFTGSLPWAHLDVAGPARSEEDGSYLCKGGTGWGVRLLVELCSSWV